MLCHHFWSLTSALPCSYPWAYPLGVRVQVQLWLPTPVGYPYSCLGNRRLSSTTFELAANGIVEVPDDEHIQRHVGTSPAWFNYITCIPLALSTCCGTFPLEKVVRCNEKCALIKNAFGPSYSGRCDTLLNQAALSHSFNATRLASPDLPDCQWT